MSGPSGRRGVFSPWANLRRHKGRLAREFADTQARIAAPHLDRGRGAHRITVMNVKGGVGKTLTACAIARHLSEVRGENVAVIDGNPHRGTLRSRLVPADVEAPYSIVHLADEIATGTANPDWSFLASWHDLVGRIRVFSNASADPGVVEGMSGEQYASVVDFVSRPAQLVIQDMGTSMMGDVALAGLDSADTLVLATDLTQDTLEGTIELITALAGEPQSFRTQSVDYTGLIDGRYADLVRRVIVVVGPSRDDKRDPKDLALLLDWLAAAVDNVVFVGRDQHLATGGLINWDLVDPEVELAHMRVAAMCAEQFPMTTSRRR